MRNPFTEKIKAWGRPLLFRLLNPGRPAYRCPVCGYRGPFKDKRVGGRPPVVRESSKCPRCAATERHRLMHLVLEELFSRWTTAGKSLLHIAPEACLERALRGRFAEYHTADLFRDDVDFREDIQAMSFADGSYDCVILSRVLTAPADLEAAVAECRRVLRPGGAFIVSERYPHHGTLEYGERRGDRCRELGVDVIDLYRRHFREVELHDSDSYDPAFQLVNLTRREGVCLDDYPEEVRAPGQGLKEVVAVCWA